MQQTTMRPVHLFRFEGDRIVEYWGFTRQVPSSRAAAGVFLKIVENK